MDGGTLFQLRNLINRRNVRKDPSDNVNVCEDFFLTVTETSQNTELMREALTARMEPHLTLGGQMTAYAIMHRRYCPWDYCFLSLLMRWIKYSAVLVIPLGHFSSFPSHQLLNRGFHPSCTKEIPP